MDDYYGDCNFEDAKELLIEDYVRELDLAQEETHTFTRRQWIEMSYACAQAEMMWRTRSHFPALGHNYHDTPEEYETECRAEMKKYRVLQKALGSSINY